MSDKIFKHIDKSREIYPLSFFKLDIKLTETSEKASVTRVFVSKKYKDSDFSVTKFYKPISKF